MDLTTKYMGLTLKNPVVPSASPLSKTIAGIRQMEDAGAGAITMYSLFEEQIRLEAFTLHDRIEDSRWRYAEHVSFFPEIGEFNRMSEGYLELIAEAKQAVDVPVIGSLNGVTVGGWIDYAKRIEQAGADALELNVYMVPTDVSDTSSQIEQIYLEILKAVKASVTIPVAMKLNPFFSSIPHMAKELDDAGANGLVLFNRFYQPDFDLEELSVVPNLVLSRSSEMRLPLRWIAILYGKVKASMALTTGVHTAEDVVKALMSGADAVNVASVLLEQGPGKIADLVAGLDQWMVEHEYESVDQMKGALSHRSSPDPEAFERANYMKVLGSWR
jgi:dihydroorotate dehydrogenase (fumarate)